MHPTRSINRWALSALFVILSVGSIVRADPSEDAIGKNFFAPNLSCRRMK